MKLNCKEAFFGGAAGGGKSDALLRAALQFVDKPKYAALILRTSLKDLEQPGALINKSHQWLTGKADWNGSKYTWTFPSGAELKFGYLSSNLDKFNYKSSEYQFIGFDELTDFKEEDYTFMFSRVRQTVDMDIPERVRSASNPGGPGHEWVKSRFITEEAERDLVGNQLKEVYWLPNKVEGEGPVAFVPSKIRDNPAIDPVKYTKSLMHLSPVMRERMMNGDWTVMPTGLIKPEWLRYFTMQDKRVDLLISKFDKEGNIIHTNEVLNSYHEDEATRFMVCDPAGGVEDIEREHQGKTLSYTAIGTFDHRRWSAANQCLLIKDMTRGYGLSYSDMRDLLKATYYQQCPKDGRMMKVYVENKAMGMALVSDLRGIMPIEAISSSVGIGLKGKADKVARNAPFTSMLSVGQIYLPQFNNSWRQPLESELLRWQGLKDETNDQIDVAGYAVIIIGGFSGGTVKCEVDPRESIMELIRDKPEVEFYGGGLMKGW